MDRHGNRIPDYLLNPCRSRQQLHGLKTRLRKAGLHTVCESAACPNIVECFARPTAAFMILGNRCNRGCRFCAVKAGAPGPVDPAEPDEVARAAAELELKHVVVTSVTRDDLSDGGASQFAATIAALRAYLPEANIEVLVPDFLGSKESVRTIMEKAPRVFNHNLETVPRLYSKVRPAADYQRSLEVMAYAADLAYARGIDTIIKSGLMVGLGEDADEVIAVIEDLEKAGCKIVTIGQYLQPRKDRLLVERYWEPKEYDCFVRAGEKLGLTVFAGPLVRSSYLADRVFDNLPGANV